MQPMTLVLEALGLGLGLEKEGPPWFQPADSAGPDLMKSLLVPTFVHLIRATGHQGMTCTGSSVSSRANPESHLVSAAL